MEFQVVNRSNHFLLTLFLIIFVSLYGGIEAVSGGGEVRRKDFPPDFIFGTASSVYQYEGAVGEGGRGPSIWDTFTHSHPERIADKSTGDVALDFYHRYKEDIRMVKDLGFDAFRFSISWSRILPNGMLCGGINKEGVKYYNNLINELIANDLKPFVTLFHWDLPQALEDKYGGFLSLQIVDDFASFAGICFREFGDRVKHWISFNEPWSFTIYGYDKGSFPPARCSIWAAGRCSAGDSAREPYTVAHHLILAHAASVRLYKRNFQPYQKGKIGITLVACWILPYSNSKADKAAANRVLDFMFGWFMEPLTHGNYPSSMRENVGHRLTKFTEEQTQMINGSFDFIGLNYYTAFYAKNRTSTNRFNSSYDNDISANLTEYREGVPIGPQAASKWLFVYPEGIYNILLHIKKKYNNPVIYITENGISEMNNGTLPTENALKDDLRIEYYRQHLINIKRAKRKGVDVRGYFAWSMFDNFEWTDGYTVRFGICYVDYKDGLKRYPKNSALWFQNQLSRLEDNI